MNGKFIVVGWPNPYEMGLQQGQLLHDELAAASTG